MKAIYLDCFSGISGNMLLGAFVDAGIPKEKLQAELDKLSLDDYHLSIEKVVKTGISATYLDVHLDHHHHSHDNPEHEHHHHHHGHRHLPDILKIIDNSTLDSEVKETSKKVFLRLAQAEAKVHGTTIDHVHFHEVGAVDTIIDIIGVVWCLHYLDIKAVYTSKLTTGFGFIKCSHGIMPIPAPATAELLNNIPHDQGIIERELVTPTGAAIIAALGAGFGEMPKNFKSEKIAYGAGTWDLEIPNVLRLYIGEISTIEENKIIIIEANIDDLNPQVYEYTMDKLFDVGALDVWLTPIVMKKSRPATLLSVLLNSRDIDEIARILFTETSTIGIRYQYVERIVAQRDFNTVETPWGEVKIKISKYNNEVCHISPEYDDCRRIAQTNKIPLKEIQQLVLEIANRNIK